MPQVFQHSDCVGEYEVVVIDSQNGESSMLRLRCRRRLRLLETACYLPAATTVPRLCLCLAGSLT